jgi:trk system potassium uptake protein TrkH
MCVGGAPGSAAGGIKLTTAAVLLANAAAAFRRQDDLHLFGRRVGQETIRSASALLIAYCVLLLSGTALICLRESASFSACLFESASALGTVGLSCGLTPQTGLFSQCILILLMFLGRIGSLALLCGTLPGRAAARSSFPLEQITIG